MSILPNLIYRFDVLYIKISKEIFVEDKWVFFYIYIYENAKDYKNFFKGNKVQGFEPLMLTILWLKLSRNCGIDIMIVK
jgi:hypothetical protein